MAVERFFVDTNILLTASVRGRPDHGICLGLLRASFKGCLSLFANGQVIREYLVVATRPLANNGLELSSQKALENVDRLRSCVSLLPEDRVVMSLLRDLVQKHALQGKRIHDANLAATMRANNLRSLLTLNGADFEAITEIEPVHPSRVAV